MLPSGVRSHRRSLVRTMEAEGFANYEKEWWHFSYAVDDPVPFDRPVAGRRQRVYASHFFELCSASTVRMVPDLERITMDWVRTVLGA